MGQAILSNSKKELRSVLVFNSMYPKAIGRMRSGSVVELSLARTNDGTLFLKDIK
jgi:hypothetical protein